MIPGIGSRRFYSLIERFQNPRNVWESSNTEIFRMSGVIGRKAAENIIQYKENGLLETARKILCSPELSVYVLEDAEYPSQLKSIYDPPPVLYCKGQLPKPDQALISIVGSRRASRYGLQMAEKIAYDLALAGVGIVSGLARGIDTAAHRGALKANGYTLGVLGSGVDVVYPPENKGLVQQMQEQGAVISEYPLGTYPLAGNFPARNRIISGLSQGVLVIEAGSRSGALITVDFALEQGRDVFALPGNINSPFSQGTNQLLKEGAKLVTSAEDILEELNLACRNHTPQTQPQAIQLDFFETQIYNALEDGEKQLEELVRITGLDAGRISAMLTMLEIKGIIKQLPGKIFVRQWKGSMEGKEWRKN